MTRLTTITALLLALSTVATAQPYPQDRRTDESYRHPGYDRGPYRGMEGAWKTFGTGDFNGPAQKFMVGAQEGRFTRLRLRAVQGAPVIRRIDVRYVDNSLQTIDVHRRLRRGEIVDLDLAGYRGRRISSITVWGRPDPYAAYDISGQY